MFGDECNPCFNRRANEERAALEAARASRWEEKKQKWKWLAVIEPLAPTSKGKEETQKVNEREQSWVEVLLSLACILCFGAAFVFGVMASMRADEYEQGPAIILFAYAISLAVSGLIFAAIGKIISSLTSVDENIRLLVSQHRVRDLPERDVDTPENVVDKKT